MNLTQLNDKELLNRTKELVASERTLLTEILSHLKEIDARKLFSDLGYKSLFEYTTKELSYSESQAWRRISAMRLMREVPEIVEKIEEGALNLSNIAQAQTLFSEAKKQEVPLTREEKVEVLSQLEGKSTREAEKVIQDKISPKILPKIKAPVVEELRIEVTPELKAKIEELKSLMSYNEMNPTELFDFTLSAAIEKQKVKKFGMKRGTESSPQSSSRVPCSNNPRYISQSIKHAVWERDQGMCCNCGSRQNLHFDHIIAVAFGGNSLEDNVQLLCFSCNQRKAIQEGLNEAGEYSRQSSSA